MDFGLTFVKSVAVLAPIWWWDFRESCFLSAAGIAQETFLRVSHPSYIFYIPYEDISQPMNSSYANSDVFTGFLSFHDLKLLQPKFASTSREEYISSVNTYEE